MKAYALGLYEKAMPNELSWKEKLQMAKEAADRLPWWKGLIIRLLERY